MDIKPFCAPRHAAGSRRRNRQLRSPRNPAPYSRLSGKYSEGLRRRHIRRAEEDPEWVPAVLDCPAIAARAQGTAVLCHGMTACPRHAAVCRGQKSIGRICVLFFHLDIQLIFTCQSSVDVQRVAQGKIASSVGELGDNGEPKNRPWLLSAAHC